MKSALLNRRYRNALRELEGAFGVRLFDRTNRGVTPTPHGEVSLCRATGVFEELRQAVDELANP